MVRRSILVLGIAFLAAGLASAHEVRPGYLELRQTTPERYEVLWKQPAQGEMILRLEPVFPDVCSQVGRGPEELIPGALLTRTLIHCDGGLEGRSIRIAGLEVTLTDVLVRVERLDGETETHMARPSGTSVEIGATESVVTRALAYLELGFQHILLGADHLLFVLGLVLIVGDRWMLLKAVSSFTVAHSLTLGLATLGLANVPVVPLNAAIALSILFLGPEIVRARRGESSLTIRHPWVVAFAFGLLHGFGFASGLVTMGLPSSEIPIALLLFNVGVEVGQLAFVFLLILLERSFRVLQVRWPNWVEAMPAYAVGGLGAYWTFERSIVLLREIV